MTYAVTSVALPSPSLVERSLEPCHYFDAFSLHAARGTFGDVDALARASSQLPRWIGALMAVRNGIVRRFGLKTEPAEPPDTANASAIVPGVAVGIFLVLARSDDEILMGLDDRHLDFRFSLALQQQADGERAVASTTVRFNNAWGRLYFAIVKPFHKLIIPALLRAAMSRVDRVAVPHV